MEPPLAVTSSPAGLRRELPQSVGKAVPNNPFDLMKQLRMNEKDEKTKFQSQQRANRAMKQDIRRETIEKKLMEAEDYTFTEEGMRRLKQYESRIMMEAEDENSRAFNNFLKEQEKLDFRMKIRREVEERQRQEEEDRRKKREAAEKRRQEIVERLRKKQEEEELALRKAEEERLAVLEKQKFEEDQARLRFLHNQSLMMMEDEYSRIAEIAYQEELERQRWKQEQARKLAEWEDAQRMKDQEEEKLRVERLRELEEKKRKLAELKKNQEISVSNQQKDLANARDESVRLGKQMKIQNKAKYVSKKIKENQENIISQLNMNDNDESQIVKIIGSPERTSTNPPTILNDKSIIATLPNEQTQIIDSKTDIELHIYQEQLLDEKRELRMREMNLKKLETSENEINAIHQQIIELNKIDAYVERRASVILSRKDALALGKHEKGFNVEILEPGLLPPMESKRSYSNLSKMDRSSRSFSQLGTDSNADNEIFGQAEKLIRDVNEIVVAIGVVGLRAVKSIEPVEGSGNNMCSITRKAEMLRLKVNDMLARLLTSDDIMGYREKLETSREKLNKFLEQSQLMADSNNSNPPAAALSHAVETFQKPLHRNDQTNQNLVVHSQSATTVGSQESKDKPCENAREDASNVDGDQVLSPAISTKAVPQSLPLPDRGQVPTLKTSVKVKVSGNSVLPSLNVVNYNSTMTVLSDNKYSDQDNNSVNSSRAIDETPSFDGSYGYDQSDNVLPSANELSFEDIDGWNECLHTTMATAAHHAAFYNYCTVLEYLSYYFDVFVMDKNGRTPLFYAALRNNLNCVLHLVSIDSQWIEVGDYRGDTVMHAAAISNESDVLIFLLSCDVNPDIANHEGLTLAHLAKCTTSLTALRDAGACLYCIDKYSRMALWYACKEGRTDCVKFLCCNIPKEYIFYPDFEGNTSLHIACASGHAEVVEILCQHVINSDDFYRVNKKSFTAAHVASSIAVFQKLYEYGVDLWICDSKLHYPLFISAFHGRYDCVAFLIETALKRDITLIEMKDKQGDTALHASCLCGHFQTTVLLLYFLRNESNKQGLTPSQLAERAGHHHIVRLVNYVNHRREIGEDPIVIYESTFDYLCNVIHYYGSRWTKLYDASSNMVYYYDRIRGNSQWERPEMFDEDQQVEEVNDKGRTILINFYTKYNPEKLKNINEIIQTYSNNFAELYIQLASRYNVQDLSIFS